MSMTLFRERGVGIHGDVTIGEGTDICGPGDINGTRSRVVIGRDCDIAAFVTINVADSSRRCVGKAVDIDRGEILLGDRVFIGTGAVLIGPLRIGSRVRIGAHVFLKDCDIGSDVVILPGSVLRGKRVPAGARVIPAGAHICT